jgi:hypothetical protein
VLIWENQDQIEADAFESSIHCSNLTVSNAVSQDRFQDGSRLFSNNVTLAAQWLKRCTDSHDRCNKAMKRRTHLLPSRILEIKGGKIRLRNTGGMRSLRYATLSHCWGKIDMLKLTNATRTPFASEVPHQSLCKTFQDAIRVTRALAIDFLWIDSLCIIQDDQLDWDSESARMSDVYEGSCLNIAAAGAENGNEGLFCNTLESTVWGHYVETTVEGAQKRFDCAYHGIYSACLTETPLAKRGWVVQERILAPRTLHFSPGQLFWECREHNACESLPYVIPPPTLQPWHYLEKQDLPDLWPAIVAFYSGCDLTYPKDKLVAISGIAQKIHDDTKDVYLAGLWRNNLEMQLLWSVQEGASLKPRPLEYRAPSWSWASIDSKIRPSSEIPYQDAPGDSISRYVTVTDASVLPSGLNTFGEVSVGVLHLRCEICFKMKIDIEDAMNSCLKLIYMSFTDGGHDDPPKWGVYWDFEGCESGAYYLLPIHTAEQETWDSNDRERIIEGLVLKRTVHNGQYERVGMFLTIHPDTLSTIMGMRAQMNIDEDDYLDKFEQGDKEPPSYLITIV